jgi:hypothetical protein
MAPLKRETLKNILTATKSPLAVGYIHKLLFICKYEYIYIWPLLRLEYMYYPDVKKASARFRKGDLSHIFYSIVYQAMCVLAFLTIALLVQQTALS